MTDPNQLTTLLPDDHSVHLHHPTDALTTELLWRNSASRNAVIWQVENSVELVSGGIVAKPEAKFSPEMIEGKFVAWADMNSDGIKDVMTYSSGEAPKTYQKPSQCSAYTAG